MLQEALQEVNKSRIVEQEYLAEKKARDEEIKKKSTSLQVCVRQMVLDIPN